MQSRPTDTSQESLPSRTPSDQSPTAQHGLEDFRGSLSDTYHGEERASTGRRSPTSSEGSGWSRSASTSTSASGGERRLRKESWSQTAYPRDRITEYEKASSTRTKKNKRHGGPEFRVIPRGDNLGSTGSTFIAFPNGMHPFILVASSKLNLTSEVLTHVLSHLPPTSLSAVSLVSRKFYELVTTPHAWRIAFSRNFPGAQSVTEGPTSVLSGDDTGDPFAEKRVFTRLTPLASWRSEYILRTQLLRCLARGKPADLPKLSRSSTAATGGRGSAHTTYNTNFFSPVTHMHASFGSTLNKKIARFIHGAVEGGVACTSDPDNNRTDPWGYRDPTAFASFADLFPGEAEYGLGAGEVVGIPNIMDVSQPYGMVYAEAYPGGFLHYRSIQEQRGRPLHHPSVDSAPEKGIPEVNAHSETLTCLWLAKSTAIPNLSEGLIGIMSGSSYGLVRAYSLGHDDLHNVRIRRGTIEASWVLSPGVPIISIVVDENYSKKRYSQGRIWAVALNALGEMFVLSDFPFLGTLDGSGFQPFGDDIIHELAWDRGRTVKWRLVERTRRTARLDPFSTSECESTLFPRSSCQGDKLSEDQLVAETREVEKAIRNKPKHFQKAFTGWDMRRRLEVDFGADDGRGAGESIFVFSCGLDEGQLSSVMRISRHMQPLPLLNEHNLPASSVKQASLFGGSNPNEDATQAWSFDNLEPARRSSVSQAEICERHPVADEWRISHLSLDGLRSPQITTTTLDKSTIALWTISEDPLLTLSTSSTSSIASSPSGSPLGTMPPPTSSSDIPGQRARFLAAGTKTGAIVLWNARAPFRTDINIVNTLSPVRIIHTESPQISCIALSALHLVHGGSDGLVQAWDVLASQPQPIRTLHSRFATRARRRLIQAEASPAGVGTNHFAAGAICLDPDPTVLRGMVSLGTHLRCWSYSSSGADQYKGNKRRLRRSERGSNQGPERYSSSGRGVLKDYISNERVELEREKEGRRKESERLAGRFGVGLLGPGASEEDMLAYARLLSEEAAVGEAMKRATGDNSTSESAISSPSTRHETPTESLEEAHAIEEALKLSLLDQTSSPIPSAAGPSGSNASTEDSDLDLALRLAQEDESLDQNFSVWSRSSSSDSTIGKGARKWSAKEEEEFPALESAGSNPEGGGRARAKGKGRRGW